MTTQAIREFFNRHTGSATGVAALVAALDAKASGAPLNPALAARIQELLAALGGANILDDVSAEEAKPLVPELRTQLGFNAKLMFPDTRGTSWNHADPQLLHDVGEFSRSHAVAITRNIVPALEGMSQRLGVPGAAFLDIGVGVAGTASAMAELWPELRVVGIDVWQPALALARANVDKAGLKSRVEIREQGAENLEDDKAFDLAWMPILFIPERIIPAAVERTHRALRPGGWVIMCFANVEGIEAVTAALWRLRVTTFGGPQSTPDDVEKLLRDKGFADVRTLPRPPGVPMGFTVGRRSPA